MDKSDTSATSSVGGLRASSKTANVGEVRVSEVRVSEVRVDEVRVGEYLEVLRIVEREGQWVEASITNWTVAVQEHKYGPLKGERA